MPSSSENPSHFSSATKDRLQQDYPELAEQLEDWQYAELSEQPGEKLAYVRLNKGASAKPLLYVPGFTEGIEAKAPFAAALAQHGFDVILPDQNRRGIIRDNRNKKDATLTQAVNYMAVLESLELDGAASVDVVTHSYGSLVFDAMASRAAERGLDTFKDSKVVMLAPAGMNETESYKELAGRFVNMILSESHKVSQEIPGGISERLRIHGKKVLDNIPRAARESLELASRQVDYGCLLHSGIGNLVIMSYAQDELFTQELLAPTVEQVVTAGGSWAVPVSFETNADGELVVGKDATHNDEQFNPQRVARAVAQVLKLRR